MLFSGRTLYVSQAPFTAAKTGMGHTVCWHDWAGGGGGRGGTVGRANDENRKFRGLTRLGTCPSGLKILLYWDCSVPLSQAHARQLDPPCPPPQNLETRQLVVKNPVVFAPPGGAITVSSVLHLPRYQPAVKLGPGQMFKVRPGPRGSGATSHAVQDWGPVRP